MEKITPAPEEHEWQAVVTERLFRMQHALGEYSANGAIIGNHHEGRAAEQLAEWLLVESKKNGGGRSLRINLGRGAVMVSLREITEPNHFDKGRHEVRPLEPRDDTTELVVDKVALVSLAATAEKSARMEYYLRDQPTGEWISLRAVGESITEQVGFINSAARQEALEEQTGMQWVPDFTGEFERLPGRS